MILNHIDFCKSVLFCVWSEGQEGNKLYQIKNNLLKKDDIIMLVVYRRDILISNILSFISEKNDHNFYSPEMALKFHNPINFYIPLSFYGCILHI